MNTLENFRHSEENLKEPAFFRLVNALIRHEKPLIGLVNGPAIGIACTTLGLFDVVIASDKVGTIEMNGNSYPFAGLFLDAVLEFRPMR